MRAGWATSQKDPTNAHTLAIDVGSQGNDQAWSVLRMYDVRKRERLHSLH